MHSYVDILCIVNTNLAHCQNRRSRRLPALRGCSSSGQRAGLAQNKFSKPAVAAKQRDWLQVPGRRPFSGHSQWTQSQWNLGVFTRAGASVTTLLRRALLHDFCGLLKRNSRRTLCCFDISGNISAQGNPRSCTERTQRIPDEEPAGPRRPHYGPAGRRCILSHPSSKPGNDGCRLHVIDFAFLMFTIKQCYNCTHTTPDACLPV